MEHRTQKLMSSPKGFVAVFEIRRTRPILVLLVLLLVGLDEVGGLRTCRRKTVILYIYHFYSGRVCLRARIFICIYLLYFGIVFNRRNTFFK